MIYPSVSVNTSHLVLCLHFYPAFFLFVYNYFSFSQFFFAACSKIVIDSLVVIVFLIEMGEIADKYLT
ncbi:hypothetical protein JCM14469_15620 [Desulfatiferula olefinivorans]